MPYRTLQFKKGEHYHITNRGLGKKKIFYEHEDYMWFINILLSFNSKYHIDIIGYCLMPNHYHLILRQNKSNMIKAFISAIQISHARKFNNKWNRKGPLFHGRYFPKHIQDQGQLSNTITYIIYNPVRANLVNNPEDWQYSSFRLPSSSHNKFNRLELTG